MAEPPGRSGHRSLPPRPRNLLWAQTVPVQQHTRRAGSEKEQVYGVATELAAHADRRACTARGRAGGKRAFYDPDSFQVHQLNGSNFMRERISLSQTGFLSPLLGDSRPRRRRCIGASGDSAAFLIVVRERRRALRWRRRRCSRGVHFCRGDAMLINLQRSLGPPHRWFLAADRGIPHHRSHLGRTRKQPVPRCCEIFASLTALLRGTEFCFASFAEEGQF